MNKFSNPLDNVRIASPCAADWNKMIGGERQRHCAACKSNVYNLSEMTQTEAENLLIKAEGRVCLQIFRRRDGTVLTKNCPVGWQALKKKVSQTAAAAFTFVAGFSMGIIGLESLKSLRALTNYKEVPSIFFQRENEKSFSKAGDRLSFGGTLSNLAEIKAQILKNQD